MPSVRVSSYSQTYDFSCRMNDVMFSINGYNFTIHCLQQQSSLSWSSFVIPSEIKDGNHPDNHIIDSQLKKSAFLQLIKREWPASSIFCQPSAPHITAKIPRTRTSISSCSIYFLVAEFEQMKNIQPTILWILYLPPYLPKNTQPD